MLRAAILGCSPYISDYWRKPVDRLFAEVGGNTGNLAFQYAVAKHIAGSPTFVNWGVDAGFLRERADIIVLPLANQLGSHTDLGAAAVQLESFRLPVIGLGLGAQASEGETNVTLTAGTERWLRTLADHSPTSVPNIGLRGAFTLSQVERMGLGDRCAIIGCPSNFINLTDPIESDLAERYAAVPSRIAVNAGIPYIPKLRNLEVALARLVGHDGAYIVQHGVEMVQLARDEFSRMTPDRLKLCHDYIMPDVLPERFLDWCRTYAFAFFDAAAWMDFLRRFNFVIGTRFHGAMLAIQAGVPAGCIAHDSRTLEMCDTMAIPAVSYAELTLPIVRNNLPSIFSFDAKSYDERRRALAAKYFLILSSAGLAVSDDLRRFCT